jgi:hypothetical protein
VSEAGDTEGRGWGVEGGAAIAARAHLTGEISGQQASRRVGSRASATSGRGHGVTVDALLRSL